MDFCFGHDVICLLFTLLILPWSLLHLQIDGKNNPKIQNVFLDNFPVMSAEFSKNGEEVVMGSKHRSFYYYDMIAGQVVFVPKIKGAVLLLKNDIHLPWEIHETVLPHPPENNKNKTTAKWRNKKQKWNRTDKQANHNKSNTTKYTHEHTDTEGNQTTAFYTFLIIKYKCLVNSVLYWLTVNFEFEVLYNIINCLLCFFYIFEFEHCGNVTCNTRVN